MMHRTIAAAALIASATLLSAPTASAEGAYIPPIVDATVTGVTSEALSDGTHLLTVDATVVNNGDAMIDGSN